MLNYLKSTLYSLIITAFLFVLLAGCSKTETVIEIDLTQQGKTLSPDMYGVFFKGEILETHFQRKTTITKVKPGTGNLKAAIGEALFMIGMERNSGDVLVDSNKHNILNINDRTWNPDMIVNNGPLAYGTPSYYAIRLFSENKPDKVMPTKVIMNKDSYRPTVYATSGLQEKVGFVIIKLVNPFEVPQVCKFILKYKQQIKYKGEAYVMTSGNILDENSVKEPEKIVPMTKELKGLKNIFKYECPANSIVIIKLRYKKRIAGLGNCC